jgi:hypothetical protein
MKAMSRGRRGQNFRRLLEYVLREGRGRSDNDVAVIAKSGVFGAGARTLGRQFRSISRLRPEVCKPVWHQALSLAPGESLPDEELARLARRFMQDMGYGRDHPFIVVRHREPGFCLHVHIVASRVSLAGQLWLGRNEHLLATRVCGDLETEFRLRPTHRPSYEKDRRGEIKIKERSYRSVARVTLPAPRLAGNRRAQTKTRLQAVLRLAIEDASRFRKDGTAALSQGFRAAAKSMGVEVAFKKNDRDSLVGVAFGLEGLWFRGSALGPVLSLHGLVRALNGGPSQVPLAKRRGAPVNEPVQTLQQIRMQGDSTESRHTQIVPAKQLGRSAASASPPTARRLPGRPPFALTRRPSLFDAD